MPTSDPANTDPNTTVQMIGAVLILGAYALLQFGRLAPRDRAFLSSNAAGAGLLAWEAWRTDQWGFLLLEATWALVSVAGLLGITTRRRARL